jgi:FemAB-related protein (PEP-CTERM system-associated)
VVEDVFGHPTTYWTARGPSGEVRGLLPLVRVRSRLFGDYLVSMPFLSYGGPLGDPAAREVLCRHATEEAERLGVDLMELRARTPVPGPAQISHRKLTVLLDLPDSPEEMWEDGLRSKVRSQVRRPMKEGMEARFGPERMDDFYAVFSETMRDLGTPVLPRSFFALIREAFPEQVLFCAVELDGIPVAAGCGFFWNGEVEITWAGSLRSHSRKAPNMLLYWDFIRESIERGASVFNFGRCSPDSGTHRFKRQWGGRDHPLPWAQWSPKGLSATPTPDSRKFQLATAAWSRLPVAVANRLGPWLSRSLP